MGYLVDTHALVWFLLGKERLSPAARNALVSSINDIYVSAASAWEITTKYRLGKLPEMEPFAKTNIQAEVASRGFLPLPITMTHAEQAGRFDDPHKDPFDRMLIAQALVDDLILISNETVFDRFGVRRLW